MAGCGREAEGKGNSILIILYLIRHVVFILAHDSACGGVHGTVTTTKTTTTAAAETITRGDSGLSGGLVVVAGNCARETRYRRRPSVRLSVVVDKHPSPRIPPAITAIRSAVTSVRPAPSFQQPLLFSRRPFRLPASRFTVPSRGVGYRRRRPRRPYRHCLTFAHTTITTIITTVSVTLKITIFARTRTAAAFCGTESR